MEKVIRQFEEKIQRALAFKYKNEDPKIRKYLLRGNILRKWDLLKFYKIYITSKVYSKERIELVMNYLFDLKIQLYYLLEADLGLYNRLIYNRGYNSKNIQKFPHIQLVKLSLDQNVISKSRILWERVMNFIYYLETGEKLENAISGSTSKKTAFFDFISKTNWQFLLDYKKYINWFDKKLRIPEVHKSSTLRKYFLKEKEVNPGKILGIINIVMNSIWENGLEIIQGKKPSKRYWNIAQKS